MRGKSTRDVTTLEMRERGKLHNHDALSIRFRRSAARLQSLSIKLFPGSEKVLLNCSAVRQKTVLRTFSARHSQDLEILILRDTVVREASVATRYEQEIERSTIVVVCQPTPLPKLGRSCVRL